MDKDELKALRLKLRLTQKQMGERLGVSRSAIAKYEGGEINISKPVSMLCQQLENHHLVVQNP
jgi:transcriptional regulator with XRE-family HTH domain